MRSLVVILALILAFHSNAQVLDSLLEKMKTANPTDKVEILVELVDQYRNSDRVKADSCLMLADEIARSQNFPLGIAIVSLTKGVLSNDIGNYREGVVNLQSAIAYLESTQDAIYLEDAYNSLGISYKRLGQLDSSIISYKKALKYVTDEYGKARLLINIGSNYISEGKLDSATENHLIAISIFEKLDNKIGLTIAYLNLGNIYYKQDAFDQSLSYYRLSLKNAIAADHKPVQSRNYLNIGSILFQEEKYDSALYYFNQARVLQESMGDQSGLAASYRNIGEANLEIGNVNEAEKYFMLSAELYENTGHKEGIIRSNKFLANLYLSKREFSEAKKYVNKSIDIAREAGIVHELQRAVELATLIYKESGDYRSAYEMLSEEKALGDSVFAEEKVLQINELQTKYETEKKDSEIASLSQQAQIQALELSQRNTQLVIAGVAILVIVLAGFIFYQQRKYKHQQAVSDIEQRMLRLQMNPHFIFNALSSIQNYILQSDTKESVKYLAKFGKLMRQILEHSREEFITIEEEVDMLTNYLQIQQLRFRDSFDFRIEVAEELDPQSMTIPPLFAQPLVENAIEHGLSGIDNGLVTITFSKEINGVGLTVSDNGRGISQTNHTSGSEHKSLASLITRERLKILSAQFRSKFSFNYQTVDQGTQASLVVPSKVI